MPIRMRALLVTCSRRPGEATAYRRAVAGVRAEAVERIRQWAEEKTPPHVRDQAAIEVSVRGHSVTIWDATVMPDGKWLKVEAAQLRHQAETDRWSLYWRYRDGWLLWDDYGDALSLTTALELIDEDPDCVFWG
jgi:hypothetical protein